MTALALFHRPGRIQLHQLSSWWLLLLLTFLPPGGAAAAKITHPFNIPPGPLPLEVQVRFFLSDIEEINEQA